MTEHTLDSIASHPASRSRSRLCVACPPGTFGNDARTECLACPAGHVSGDEGSTECSTECQPGFYASSDATECLACEDGYYSTEAGQIECLRCDEGRHTSDDATACVECEGNSISFGGQTECTECTHGFADESHTSCRPCDPGFTVNDDSTRCIPCPQGQKRAFEDALCSPCEAGRVSDKVSKGEREEEYSASKTTRNGNGPWEYGRGMPCCHPTPLACHATPPIFALLP